jgi:ADP-ribose pyrophosphatase YjhB (NUDIX family)
MKVPLYTSEYVGHAGVRYVFEWYEVDTYEDLPKGSITQCYAVAFYNGKMIVVNNVEKPGTYTLIGGSVEEGEDPNDTLIREIQEESNMRVLEYTLLGYQKVIDTRGIQEPHYQLRYAALVEPYGPFVSDPAGKVTEVVLCDPSEYKKYFDWGEIGDEIVSRAVGLMGSVTIK